MDSEETNNGGAMPQGGNGTQEGTEGSASENGGAAAEPKADESNA